MTAGYWSSICTLSGRSCLSTWHHCVRALRFAVERPWDVFHEHALYKASECSGAHGDGHEDLHTVQELGALRAFQALPTCRQRTYTAVSLQELSGFAAWSATSGLADAVERVAAWTGLDVGLKADHVPHNWRALLAKDPTWHVLIADDVKEKRQPRQEKRPHHRAHQGKPWQTQGAADDDSSLHKPVRRRPAAQARHPQDTRSCSGRARPRSTGD